METKPPANLAKTSEQKHTKTHTPKAQRSESLSNAAFQTSLSGEFSETKRIKQHGIIPGSPTNPSPTNPSPTKQFLRFESLLELDPKIIETKQIIRGEAKVFVRFWNLPIIRDHGTMASLLDHKCLVDMEIVIGDP